MDLKWICLVVKRWCFLIGERSVLMLAAIGYQQTEIDLENLGGVNET